MRILPRRLNSQMILLVTGILLATGAVSGWIAARNQSQRLLATMRGNSEVIVKSLSASAAHYLVLQDYAGLETFLLKSAELPDLTRLQVCEPEGMIVGDAERAPGGQPRSVPGAAHRLLPPPPAPTISFPDGALILWEPVDAGTRLGWIKATYSLASIHQAQAKTWRESLLLALLWAASSALLLLLVLRPAARAFSRLSAFARRLDESKGEQVDPGHRAIEIEELGASLNFASSRLYSTEQQLIQERERLRVLLRSIHDGVVAANASGAVVFMNRSSEELTGWSAQEAAGRQVGEVFRLQSSQPRDAAGRLLPALIGSGAGVELDTAAVLVAKNGVERPIAGSTAPILDDAGGVSGMVIVFHDVGEQRQAERQIHQLAAIVRSSDDAIIGKDLDGTITSWNGGAEKIYGYAESEIIGRSVAVLIPQERREEMRLILQRVGAGEHVEHHETQRLHKDGTRLFVSITVSPIRDSDGRVVAASTIARDVTDQKRAEQRLALLDFALNNVREEAYLINEEGRFEYVNNASCQALGFSGDELLGMHVADVDPDFPPERWTAHWREIRERGSITFEGRHRARDGRIHPVEIGANYFEYGGQGYDLALARNISERKRADAELARVSRALRMLSDSNQALIRLTDEAALLDEICRIAVDVGSYRMAWVGYAEPDGAKRLRPIAHAGLDSGYIEAANVTWDDSERGRGPGGTAIRTGKPCLVRNIHSDPTFAPWREEASRRGYEAVLAMPLTSEGRTFGVLGIYAAETAAFEAEEVEILNELAGDLAFGISALRTRAQREQAIEELTKSEERYKQLLGSVTDYIYTVVIQDNRPVATVHGPGCANVTGYAPEDYAADPDLWYRMVYEPDRAAVAAQAAGILAGEPTPALEHRILHRDGSLRWVRNTPVPRHDEQWRLVAYDGLIADITERKRAEELLREREAFIRRILDSVDEGFVIVDDRYRIVSANRAFCRLMKLPEDRVVGRHCYEVSHHAARPCFESGERCTVNRTFGTGSTQSATHTHVDAAGASLDVQTSSYPVTDASGKVTSAILTMRDITEERRLEEQLRQAQKMEAIGTLAGGVAHDFNNILTAIIGYGSIVKMKLKTDDPQQASLDQILQSADRAAHLTQGLLAFSRKQVIKPRPVEVNDIVRNVERLLRRLIGEDVELSILPAEGGLISMADSGQIEQVLMNLATNARDAMPEGGALTITTEQVELGEDFVSANALGKPGAYALITVSDTGLGMDETTREKIFEPFFTTKEVGKGTGLGLAIVYGIVKQHDGTIGVQSEPGKGTTFRIHLPLIAAQTLETYTASALRPPGGTETILLAEDDAEVRNLTRTILAEFGYRVIEAVDGEDAIEKYARHADEIDLLLADVVMPKKSGREVYDAVRTMRPDAAVLFISGYTADVIHQKGVFEEGLEFIAKPVSPYELVRRIRAVLDKHPEAGPGGCA